MNNLIRRVVCMIAFTACFALPALADSVAFTDLGPGGSYGPTVYSAIDVGQSVAYLFKATVGGTLSQIDLGLTNASGTNSAIVSVYTDVGNMLETLLFSGMVSNQPPVGSTSTLLATLSASSGALVAGDSYFLAVAPGAADTTDHWLVNNIGAQGTVGIDDGSGFFFVGQVPLAAFDVRVNTTAVPEPSTWLMIGAELLCLFGVASWKRSVSVH